MTPQHPFAIRALAFSGASLVAGAGVLLWSGTASADPGSSPTTDTQVFDLASEAVALQSTATDPAVPLGLPFSVGSYGASSILSSNGDSKADAGAPYSPLVSSLPSTGNGVAQSSFGAALPVVPSFPGYVSASDSVKPLTKQTAGGYELEARAEPDEASGTVSIGGQAATSPENNAFAYSDSRKGLDGTVITTGSAGVHALTLGGIMDLANVSSYASMTFDSTGKPVPATRTLLGTISFAGLTSGVTGDGISGFGSAPTPISPDGFAALNSALAPAGFVLSYVPETYRYTDGSTSIGPKVDTKRTVSGLTSGALRIRFSNTSARGVSTETITVGQVSIDATNAEISGAASLPSTDSGTTAAPVAAAPAAPVPTLGFVAAIPHYGEPVSSTAVVSEQTTQRPAERIVTAARQEPLNGPSVRSLYMVVVASAVVALLGGQLIRMFAVRRR
jgi:hypothetical protein